MISLGTCRRSLPSLFYFVCALHVWGEAAFFFFKQVLVNVNFLYFKYIQRVAYADDTEMKLWLSAFVYVCVCARIYSKTWQMIHIFALAMVKQFSSTNIITQPDTFF